MSPHPIVHIELSANNLASAAQFYKELFGWQVQSQPELNYATWDPGEGPGGGFNPTGTNTTPGTVTVYVGTDDIEATLNRIEELGGSTVYPKTEIPNMGWFAMFKDPTGNVLGLYTGMQQST